MPSWHLPVTAGSRDGRRDDQVRIGILTGGGDCPGLNAVIRAVVLRAVRDHGWQVTGFRDGWRGVLEDHHVELEPARVRGILARGGTILGSSRVNPDTLRASIDTIRSVLASNGIDALIPVGGEGTLQAAHWLSSHDIPVVGVPKTIDNDIDCTDVTFGFDTAVEIATDAIDRLHTTAESHQRVMVVEVMGRHTGWIALHSALAAGAHQVLTPETPFDIEQVCAGLRRRFDEGDNFAVLVAAEGATPAPGTMPFDEGYIDQFGHRRFAGIARQLQAEIGRRLDREVTTTVLGHLQRGGTPTAYDRVLASRLGGRAVEAIRNGKYGTMSALRGTQVELVPLVDAVARLKTVPGDTCAELSALL
ncbi:ATP-dependent 6-phosphofructokinase 3 [Actinocatenispora sera]|uniref:ATP-dependent 6-phosphofructokinase n=1 Tax=Actinocatenispora sera TaxID=390989 RepID=A0A810KXW2_9ACTN|nr:ATP-dependent 6-phosphofructokinase 3 [Actinocatenispora sera]